LKVKWSREEIERLRELVAAGHEWETIAARLGRSVHACETRAVRLGIRRPRKRRSPDDVVRCTGPCGREFKRKELRGGARCSACRRELARARYAHLQSNSVLEHLPGLELLQRWNLRPAVQELRA